jgi:hypothetical protein
MKMTGFDRSLIQVNKTTGDITNGSFIITENDSTLGK